MTRNLTIALNGSMLDDKPTGVGVYTYNLINTLISRSERTSDIHYKVFSPTYSHLNDQRSIIKLSGLLQSSRFGKISAIGRFLWNSCIYPIQAMGTDLSVSPTTHGSIFSRQQIITIHDLLSLRFENISVHQRGYFRFVLPLMVRNAKAVVAVSEATKADIIKYLGCPPEKITVIYNGYDKLRFRSRDHSLVIEEKYGVRDYFLAVGPNYPHKNFERLLEAYAGLNKGIKLRHQLLIVGGLDPYLGKIKKLVLERNLSDCILFTGYAPADHMPHLYGEAFALLFPSLYEGFGFPLLEAMASGCPVLCSRTSSMPEVCGNAARYFDPSSPISIRSAIETLIDNPELRDMLKERGLARAKLFSWDKTADELLDLIYKQIPSKTTQNV